MPDDLFGELKRDFDVAFDRLAVARLAYEDQPRDPDRIAALGAARAHLDQSRAAMDDERQRMRLMPPWRVTATPAAAAVNPPPLWSIDHGPES